VSSNAADFFAAGLKGRWNEAKDYADHSALGQHHALLMPREGRLVEEEVPLRNAMNEILRGSYIADCERVVKRWNAALEDEGVDFRVSLPDRRFFRRQGIYANLPFDREGNLIAADEWETRRDGWLPSDADRRYVTSLMRGVHEPGKMAHWIAPPRKGINAQAVDFEYVRFEPS
jgi:benzoyl-CoA 2,3-dioxygenase component B